MASRQKKATKYNKSHFESKFKSYLHFSCELLSTVGTPNKGHLILDKLGQEREIWEFPYLPLLQSDSK